MNIKTFINHLRPYCLLMRLDRPIGLLLLLWPTWWALWAASGGNPQLKTWAIFTTGVFLMRAAGCVINDISDRQYDGHVNRTKNRPLVQKTLSIKNAWYLFFGLMFAAGLLLLALKKTTVLLALVAAFFAVTYPIMKRVTYLPQVYLGIAFSFSIPMAYAEITGSVPKIAWLLFIANILWTTAYDTIYAMVDRKDDLKIGVKSTAILFGDLDRVIIGIIQLLTVLALFLFGKQAEFTAPYFIAVIIVLWLFVYQQLQILERNEIKCFKAFLHNNWIGMVIFIGIFSHFLLKS